ncbi:MAG TPA: hypothetical protein VIU81_07530 [Gaiellaceae bacterium]
MTRLLAITALVLVAAAGALAANLALLNYAAAADDPIGKLSPRANLPAAPADVVRPRTGPIEHDRNDD